MQLSREELHKLLVEPGHIKSDKFEVTAERALAEKKPLEELLISEKLITEDNLGRAIALGKDYRFFDLSNVKISQKHLALIPEAVAYAQKVFIFEETDRVYKLATYNPENFEFIKMLEQKLGKTIEVYFSTKSSLESILKLYRGRLGDKIKETISLLNTGQIKDTESKVSHIVRLVNIILDYAQGSKASDIHIEPLEGVISIRFRVDGILHEVAEYPRSIHDQIVSRIKILAHLRTDERATPQDGRFVHVGEGGMFDIRVSIMPVTDGENIVMRLLVEQDDRLSLDDLGLRMSDKERIVRAMQKSNGMILSVGPTGSGKTTTLYTLMQNLNQEKVNIMSIEDPVEYNISHVQQIQVNVDKDLTFANGLRSLVRQDPDIIMVGEIRDNETAKMAVNAAMTGHLLLSTLHTNNAATTFPRLIEMGIEPFLVASSVVIIVAQRLVRKICDKCKMSYELSNEEIKNLLLDVDLMKEIRLEIGEKDISKLLFYKGVGCSVCGETGYVGRVGVFEIMEITESLRAHILARESSNAIDNAARLEGMTSILSDGLVKALNGTTTIDEVLRVTRISI